MFSAMSTPLVFENTLSKAFYDEKSLFVRNYQDDTLSDDAIRFATYVYLVKFGIPEDYDSKNAYCMWKRFVYNIVTNSSLKSRREDVCEAFVFFDNLVDTITNDNEVSVLDAISEITNTSMTAAIKMQAKEEMIKALLMKDITWKKLILDAEDYFEDGQIGFILDSCKTGANTWDSQVFAKYTSLYKKFFDKSKKQSNVIGKNLFERALLCMPDSSGNHTAHLLKQSNSTTSWGFLGKDYKEFLANTTEWKKRQILNCLLDKLDGSVDYIHTLTSIINSINESDYQNADAWKLPFIKNDLFDVQIGYYRFKNCINLSDNRKEVLMIAGTTVRAYSIELYTFLLYRELQKQKIKNMKAVLYTTASMNNHEGFPLRYLEIGGAEIGYSYAVGDAANPYLYKTYSGIQKMTFDDVVDVVKVKCDE